MGNAQKDFKKKVTVEDLLQFKRQEQPDAAFWDKFDRELKQKTLKAFVAKPSWRARLGQVLLVSLRPVFPVASAALIALAFINYNQISFTSGGPTSEVLVMNDSLDAQNSWDPSVLGSTTKHYVKNTLSSQSSLSSQGMHYIAGNMSNINLATAVKSNTLF